jgi:sulfofructose kinase
LAFAAKAGENTRLFQSNANANAFARHSMNLPFKLPEDREFDVAGFGTNAVDYLIRIPRLPEFGSKLEASSTVVEPGGEAASTMFGLQRLGFKTAYAGSFGDDAGGELGLRSLVDAAVDCSLSRVVENTETQVAFIFIDESSGERTILWRRDQRLAFSPSDAPLQLAASARILHLTPHDFAASITMARAAKAAGTIVSLDIDNDFEGVEELLELVDICIMSEDLPQQLTGFDGHEEQLTALSDRFGSAVLAMTLGLRGSLALCRGGFIRSEGFGVPGGCVDTTGAGDAFRTGFLFGVLEDASIAECCSYANACAALKCRDRGARRGLPTREELQTMLNFV